MSEQSDALNKFSREKAGGKVDAPGFRGEVLPGGDDGNGAEKKPRYEYIELPKEGRPLGQFAREMGRICEDQDIFRRETVAITINRETGQMEAMSADRFRTYVEDFAVTHVLKPDGKDADDKTIWSKRAKTMRKEEAGGVLSADSFIYQLRKVDRVNSVRLPVMRKDGRIELLSEGYDKQQRAYTMKSDVEIREMEPDQARKIIDGLYNEFPFGDVDNEGKSRSKAVAIASLLSPYISGLQELTARRLNFVFTANSPRSGKSLLAEVSIIINTGSVEIQTIPESKEELRKILETEALAGAPYIYFDNLKGHLDNAALEAFMTAPIWSGRLMNSQKKFKAPKLSQLFMTGNNLTLSTDIANRTLHCELYVKEADPQDRKIKRLIDHSYLARDDVRSDVLSALWALVRFWDEQGRPGPHKLIRGFEEWSRIIGGIITSNGWADPLERPEVDNAGDTELRDMRYLVEKLAENVAPDTVKEYTFPEIGQLCVENSLFEWMIDYTEKAGEHPGERIVELKPSSKSIMGKMLAGKYGGRTFTMADGRRCEFGNRGVNRHRKYEIKVLVS